MIDIDKYIRALEIARQNHTRAIEEYRNAVAENKHVALYEKNLREAAQRYENALREKVIAEKRLSEEA